MSTEHRTPMKAWPGLKFRRRVWNRRHRQRARRALRCDHDDGALAETHRHRGMWDCW